MGPAGAPGVPGSGRSLGCVMQARPSVVVTPSYLPVRLGMMMRSSTLPMKKSMSSCVSAVLKSRNYLKEPTVGWLSSSLPSRTGASGSQVNSSNSRFSATATSAPFTYITKVDAASVFC